MKQELMYPQKTHGEAKLGVIEVREIAIGSEVLVLLPPR